MNQKPYAAVIGLGLIGGSAAKCLQENYQVIGYDPNQASLQAALKTGVIYEGYLDPNERLSQCEIVYLAAPVHVCCRLCKELAKFVGEKTVVTDLCSTKREIVKSAVESQLRFVGGHPMAGSEQRGFGASYTGLMENAYYLIVPVSHQDREATELVSRIAKDLFHAIPLELTPEEHDKAVGLISHLPHALSASLVNLVKHEDTPNHLLQKIAAGGFRDITRISSSDPELWNSICNSNRDILADLLKQTADFLSDFSEKLEQNQAVTEVFQVAKEYRDEIEGGLKNEQGYELMMDVEDKPGVIGQIATLLGNHRINITNISISNSREFEGGVLRVRIKRQEDVQKAITLLEQNNFHAKKK